MIALANQEELTFGEDWFYDANGNIITDPATCKRGRYGTFVGYFEVGPN